MALKPGGELKGRPFASWLRCRRPGSRRGEAPHRADHGTLPPMEHRYRIVNVFTQGHDPFSGNPLAVFEDARQIAEADMQRLALQFNLSETSFLLPSDQAERRVRIFTPAYEMPFAGHPTLGSAYVVGELLGGRDAVRLELPVGVIPVARRGQRFQLRANAPTHRPAGLSSTEIAALLGVAPADLAGEPLWVNTGNEQLIVPLGSEAAVRAVQVDPRLLLGLPCAHGNPKVYAFVELGGERVYARFFFPQGASVLEDPATGSACANLGGYFLATGAALPLRRLIQQGDMTGRPSTLHLEIGADGAIEVGGDVIELGSGVIRLVDRPG